MSYYKQLSGAQKRRKKNSQDAQLKCIKGSMDRFVKVSRESELGEEEKSVGKEECGMQNTQNVDQVENYSEEQMKNYSVHRNFEDVSEIPSNENLDAPGEIENSTCISVNSDDRLHFFTPGHEKVSEKVNYVFASKDIGLWPDEIDDEFREYFTQNKPCQNMEMVFSSKCIIRDKNRSLNESSFYRRKKNNELVKREWLVFSPSKNAVFCYICKLFSTSNQALCKGGFSYWKNTTERLQEHENSSVHRNSVLSLSKRLSLATRIDHKLVQEYQAECLYWRKVLSRVVHCVKFLSQRGLACFGGNETVYSQHNGNFLGCIELLSQFDPFLSDHLSKYGNPGTGNVNYLSSTTVAEVIEIMGQKVSDVIIAEVKKSKYFGLILDSTPDISHNDQLAVVLRYVNESGEPVERFVKFLHIHSHHSSHLTNDVISLLEELGIDIQNCRGQSYDNASNMSGKYSGLQSRIKNFSPLAEYIPCSAHSLNLVGHNSVECCEKAVSFFGLVQNLYVFFSSSTHRWEVLSSKLGGRLTLKPVSSTRWSAAADATKCLRSNYNLVGDALQLIIENSEEKPSVRHEARALKKKLEKFEMAVLTVVWDTILQRLNSVNKSLQTRSGSISVLIPLYDSLISFVQSVRDSFKEYEIEATNLVKASYELKRDRKTPKGKFLDVSENAGVNFTNRDTFKINCYYVICDALLSELQKRKSSYMEVQNRFGFLMKTLSEESIKNDAKNFQSLYKSDIDEEFVDEVYQFLHFLPEETSPEEKLKIIRTQNIAHTFPNVDIALQILLTLPISNCTSERAFSVLKRVKNRLRSTVKQDNLVALSILCIESDLTSKLDFEDVIDMFASKKVRKKPLVI